MIEKEIVETFVQSNHDTWLGGIAGFIAYLYDLQVATDEKSEMMFSWLALVTNITMGAFVSYIVGTALAEGMEYRTLIVGLSGFSAYSLLALARSQFAATILDKLVKKG